MPDLEDEEQSVDPPLRCSKLKLSGQSPVRYRLSNAT